MRYNKIVWMRGLKKFKKLYLPFFVFVGLFQWGFLDDVHLS